MADTELNIVLKLLDQASAEVKKTMSGITNETKKTAVATEKTGKTIQEQFKEAGKQLKDFRRTMLLVTVAVATIISSVKEAGKYNEEARLSFVKFNSEIQKLSAIVGTNLVPALNAISTLIEGLRNGLKLVVAGFIKSFSFIAEFVANIMKGPVKAYEIAMDVANRATDDFLTKMDAVEDKVSQLNAIDAIKYKLQEFNDRLERMRLLYIDAQISAREYFNFIISKEAEYYREMEKRLQIMEQLVSWQIKFSDIMQLGINTGEQFASSFGNAMGKMALEGGKFRDKMREVFRDMAMSFISEISKMIAKQLLFNAIRGISGMFGMGSAGTKTVAVAPAKHSGGIIKAHSGLAVDEVPIIAQSGEGILSRRGMANLDKLNKGGEIKGGGVVININPVVQLWDATDISRNNRTLVNAINEAIINNQQIRQVIRNYT